MRVLLLTALALVPAACTGKVDGAAGGLRRERHMTTAAPGSLGNPRILNCANRNASFPGEREASPVPTHPDDLVLEPLIIPGLRAWADADPASFGRDGRYKVGVVVRAGATATLSIPAEYHDEAGLLYGNAAGDARTPREADHAITFTACAGHDTPFPGMLFVPRRRHVPLVVTAGTGPAAREVVSFFAGRR